MQFFGYGLNILLCAALLSLLFAGGCTTAGPAGTYTGINSPSSVIVLHTDGTMDFRNSVGAYSGNYTLNGNTLTLIRTDENDATSALFTTMEPNGTFSIGTMTYRKTS